MPRPTSEICPIISLLVAALQNIFHQTNSNNTFNPWKYQLESIHTQQMPIPDVIRCHELVGRTESLTTCVCVV